MGTSNSFFSVISELLSRLFGSPQPPAPVPPPPTPPAIPSDSTTTPPVTVFNPRVMLIIYDPVVDPATGRRLHEARNWQNPDALVQSYIADVTECSGGLVNYRLVGREVVDEIPVKADTFQYQVQDYVNALNTGHGFHDADAVNYNAILQEFDLMRRAANNEFDEVWLFGGPYFGFNEATMAGAGAFFVNGGPIPDTEGCPRRFVIMGFNYERGVGEMLEDLGHRTEYSLGHVFGNVGFVNAAYGHPPRFQPTPGGPSLFERYMYFDLIAPGNSNVGSLHYAPNSPGEYLWGDPTPVPSCCEDWLAFPNLPSPPNYRNVTAADWGGEIRGHHKWWLKHLPKVAGTTQGFLNNWWAYVIDVNNVK